jgi:hypothetical protein
MLARIPRERIESSIHRLRSEVEQPLMELLSTLRSETAEPDPEPAEDEI